VRLPQFDVKLAHRRQLHREVGQPHCFDPMRQGYALRSGIDDQSAHGLKTIAGDMKSAFDLGRQTAFDLDGPSLEPGGSSSRSISAPADVRS